MIFRAFLTVGVLVLLVAVPPGSAAQDAAPTKTERLSVWIAEKVAESQRRTFRAPIFSDDDAARATQQIEQELAELRAGFPPASLDVEGLVMFRRYERMAEIGLGDIKWRVQFEQHFRQAAQDTATPATVRLPADYYHHLIASVTTTNLTSQEVRTIGERELARIHGEVRSVMQALGRTESLERFFEFLRTDDRFFYPDTDDGREAYLAETRRVLAEIRSRLDEVIVDPPDVPLEVVRNSSGQEAEALPMYMAGKAYLVPLADMRASPKYLLQTIAYHEGAPGHHLQFTVHQARRPDARRSSFLTDQSANPAYAEGWGFYAERLAYELGLYTDPYANAGRLGMEAWRAARLVVDVGLNVDGWSEAQGIAFLLANTPLPEALARIEVRRFRNSPGHATAYMIGKLAIERQRARATAALGARFDLRAFHDQVLRYGPMPLTALEEVIDRWMASSR